ncbi:DUF6325 family protein [Streptomyces showdoensis]|uniref:DUF1269 domain-containing protein n=1 Tax=Streptomyces showdoensis TaxID=68268 RepID=A0A2P2GEG8_STREW|nr:DUF6325 family protein [Streptomyces showdoensis]KKZ69917.1 hypothetical protein VO63_31675 [Streptomyces showdoensis]
MGPVECLVLAFPGERLKVAAVTAVADLRKAGQVRLIDSLVVTKSATGEVSGSELADYEEYEEAAAEIGPEANLLGPEDAAEVAETLEPGSCALMLLVEHVWAAEAAQAVREAGGHVAGRVPIPHEFVEQARTAYREAVATAATTAVRS